MTTEEFYKGSWIKSQPLDWSGDEIDWEVARNRVGNQPKWNPWQATAWRKNELVGILRSRYKTLLYIKILVARRKFG